MIAAMWATVAVPAAVGAALAFAPPRAERWAATTAIVTSFLVLGLSVAVAGAQPAASVDFIAGNPFAVGVDFLTSVVMITVSVVATLVLIFSADEITEHRRRFFGLVLIFVAAVILTSTATTLTTVLFAWEVMGATSYALISLRWRDAHRVNAGNTAFLATRFADIGLYVATAALLAGLGSGVIAEAENLNGLWLHIATAGILLAALGKAAQLPFSFWLSRAMEGPTPVSALLHSAAMVAMGGYLLLRFQPLLATSGWGDDAAAWIGALTAVVMGLVAVAQSDLKQLLAASTSAQIGFIIVAAGVGSVAAGTMHFVAHAAVKAALFLAAGAWLSALGTKQLEALSGVGRRYPIIGVPFAAAGIALAGAPPLSLWWTKEEILGATLAASTPLFVIMIFATFLSAVYAIKAVVFVFRPLPVTAAYDTEEHGTRRVTTAMAAPVALLAAGAVALGVQVASPLVDRYDGALAHVALSTESWKVAVSLVGVAAGAAVALRRPAMPLPLPPVFRQWLHLEGMAHRLLVRPVMGLARLLARFDDRLIDGVVLGVAGGVMETGRWSAAVDDSVVDASVTAVARAGVVSGVGLRHVDDGVVDRAVEVTANAFSSGARVLRRVQTGQVHHYFAFAAIGGALAAALLVAVS